MTGVQTCALPISLSEENFNSKLSEIKGILYKENGEIKITAPRGYIQDLDALPFPARHLYPPLSEYRPVPASFIKLPLGHIMTSRGCPYQCIFCDRKIFGNSFRARSPKNVVDELEELINVHGAKEIKFFDDTFTLDKKRVLEIFKEMKRRNLKFPWSCLTRVNHVDAELLKEMKTAGCWQISYGLESGDQRMLNIMKKGTTVEQNRNAVIWAKKTGLNVRAFFVLGMPGETPESLKKTVEFAKSLPIDIVTFYSVTLYPGNELYEMAKKEGRDLKRRNLSFSTGGNKGCVAGQLIALIDHHGNVQPCSYFPKSAGNIKEKSFKEIWDNSQLLKDLRDFKRYKGKCGNCEYLGVCGGCRARSYAISGDYMDEEPYCNYVPLKKTKK